MKHCAVLSAIAGFPCFVFWELSTSRLMMLWSGWRRLTAQWRSHSMSLPTVSMSSSIMKLSGPSGAVVWGHGRRELVA